MTYEDPKIAGGAPLSRSGKIIIDTSDLDRTAKKEATTAKTNKMSARKMERAAGRLMFASMAISMAGPGVGQALGSGTPSSQAAWSGGSNILSMAAMGAMAGMYTGNPFIALGGGIAGAGLGALGMDWGMAFGEEGEKADAAKLKDEAETISEALGKVGVAIATLGDLDYMTVGQKITAYVQFQKEVLDLQDKLLSGGDSMKGARETFYSDPQIQKIIKGDVSNMDAKDFDRVSTVIRTVKNRARDIMSAGNYGDFERKMTASSAVSRQIDWKDREEARGTLSDKRREERRPMRVKQAQNIFDLYGSDTQVQMATTQINMLT